MIRKVLEEKLKFFNLALLLFLLFFLSASSFASKSITMDEEKYIKMGRYIYQRFSWDREWMILHPPLTYYLQGASWYIFSPQNEKEALFYARLMMQPVLLLFALSLFLVVKKKYGRQAALFALFLFVFNPEILAHGRLIGIDLTLAFFIFLSLIAFYQFLQKPDFKRIILGGISLGLALLTKYTALLLLPFFFFTLIYLLLKEKKLVRQRVKGFLIIIFLVLFLLNLGYLFKGSFTLPLEFKSKLFSNLNSSFFGRLLLLPFPEPFLRGADFQYHLSQTGWIGFLLGETKWGGWWYFYPFAFLIKTPLPFLILILLFLIWGRKRFFEHYLLFAIFFFFFYLSFFNSINNGLRYILMIYPLFMILVGSLVSNKKINKKRGLKLVSILLLFWYIRELLFIYPHYLAYFNQLIGGPKNGYLYLADSNLDFNQDSETASAYFALHREIKVNPEKPTTGKIGVSVNFLNLSHQKDFWLRRLVRKFKKRPEEYINYTWLIFEITKEDIDALF